MKLSRTVLRISIFCIVMLVFARLIPCDFTWWDDQGTIHQNPRMNPPTWNTLRFYWTTAGPESTPDSTMGLYIPVTYTLWSGLACIAHRATPDDNQVMLHASVFHACNVLLHAATAAVIFQLLLRLFGRNIPAAIGALLFALQPVRVESVGWVSGTKDILCGLLCSSALLCYVASRLSRESLRTGEAPVLRTTARARWIFLLGTALFILAMLSKPTSVMMPLMAAAIGIFILNESPKRTIRSLLPWFVLMIPCLIWTPLVQPPTALTQPLPIWIKPVIAADALAFDLCKLVWPAHLCIDYGHNPANVLAGTAVYFSWLVPATVTALLWFKRKLWRAVIAAALVIVFPLLPVLGFVPFEFQAISTTSDHYLYLPMLGVAMFVCYALSKLERHEAFRNTGVSPVPYDSRHGRYSRATECRDLLLRQVVAYPAMFIVLAAFATRSAFQEPTWQNTDTLMHQVLAVNPRSVIAFDGLGFLAGRDARNLPSQSPAAKAKFDESIRWYQQSLAVNPASISATLNLWLDYQQLGMHPPVPTGPHGDALSVAHQLIKFGDLPAAVDWLDEALRENPGNLPAAAMRERAITAIDHPSRAGPATGSSR